MWNRIHTRGISQTPKDENDSSAEYDFSPDFDARAQEDDGILLRNYPKNTQESIKLFLKKTRDKISNWFQPVRDFLRSKFAGAQSAHALMNIKQNSAHSTTNFEKNPVAAPANSATFPSNPAENSDFRNTSGDQITSEKNKNNPKDFDEFEKFKKIYEKYKKRELNSIDNFKTENAKNYAERVIKIAEENVKNDRNYFFKNVAEYKDIVIASAVLDTKNKFALANPLEEQQKNFQLWATSKDPEVFAKFRASETGLSVNLEKAKIYADWIVFQNLIGELPENVDRSIIPLAAELRNMMESAKEETTKVETAKAKTAIASLNDDAKEITRDLMSFFENPTSDNVAPLSPSAHDQWPVTSVKPASVAELAPKPLVSSNPPPPPPPRLKLVDPAAKVNLVTSPSDVPPPPSPPRVASFPNTPTTKTISSEAVITLRAPEVFPENEIDLSMDSCVQKLNNLPKKKIDALREIIAPGINKKEFENTFKQSQLFFSDFMGHRQIDRDRQEYTKNLADLWRGSLANPVANIELKKLDFYSELNNLLEMFRPRN